MTPYWCRRHSTPCFEKSRTAEFSRRVLGLVYNSFFSCVVHGASNKRISGTGRHRKVYWCSHVSASTEIFYCPIDYRAMPYLPLPSLTLHYLPLKPSLTFPSITVPSIIFPYLTLNSLTFPYLPLPSFTFYYLPLPSLTFPYYPIPYSLLGLNLSHSLQPYIMSE